MDKASKNHPDVTNPLLPGMDPCSSPYILSKSEQSLIYAEFVDDETMLRGIPLPFGSVLELLPNGQKV